MENIYYNDDILERDDLDTSTYEEGFDVFHLMCVTKKDFSLYELYRFFLRHYSF